MHLYKTNISSSTKAQKKPNYIFTLNQTYRSETSALCCCSKW